MRFLKKLQAALWFAILCWPAAAFAAGGGTGGCAPSAQGQGGFDLSNLTTALQGVGNLFANTYLKIGLIIGIAIIAMMLMFDGGQLPQWVRTGLVVIIGVSMVFAALGFVTGQGAVAVCG